MSFLKTRYLLLLLGLGSIFFADAQQPQLRKLADNEKQFFFEFFSKKYPDVNNKNFVTDFNNRKSDEAFFGRKLSGNIKYEDGGVIRSQEVINNFIIDLYRNEFPNYLNNLEIKKAFEANEKSGYESSIKQIDEFLKNKDHSVYDVEAMLKIYARLEKEYKEKDGKSGYYYKIVDAPATFEEKTSGNETIYVNRNNFFDSNKSIDLSAAIIHDTINFKATGQESQLVFEKPVYFRAIKLTTHMNFEGNSPEKPVVFKEDVSFEGAEFNSGTGFAGIIGGSKNISFKNVTFEKNLSFKKAIIKKDVTLVFENVSIDGTLDLSDINLVGNISFTNVSYKALKLGDNFYLNKNKSNKYRKLNVKNVTSILQLKKYILNKVLVSSVEGKDVLIEKINIVEGMCKKTEASERAEIYMQLPKDKLYGDNDKFRMYKDSNLSYKEYFDLVLLKNKTIDAPIYDVLDFSYAQIGGLLTFYQAENDYPVPCPVKFIGTLFQNAIEFKGDSKEKSLKFNEDVSFDRAIFELIKGSKTVFFKNVIFEKNLSFKDAIIKSGVTLIFENVKIIGSGEDNKGLNLSGLTLEKDAKIVFKGNIDIANIIYDTKDDSKINGDITIDKGILYSEGSNTQNLLKRLQESKK